MERADSHTSADSALSPGDVPTAPSWRARVTGIATRMFGADLRSLAALRIVLALIVLADLAGRATNLRAHYTDEGVLPRDVLIDGLAPERWSLALVNGSEVFQAALFLLTAVAAVWLLLGYRTRLMIVVVWALMYSIQTRNPLVLSAADTLLRLLLFWGMLLPLGAVWSIDATRRIGRARFSTRFLSVGTLGLFLQIALMYWITAALKTGDDWREDGSALFYALGAEQLTTPFGEWAQQFPDVLRVLTFAALGVEVIAPILLFSPFRTTACRLIAIATLMGMHLGILLTMNIGIFPWTSAFCMLAFLPGPVWDWLEPRVRAALPAWRDRLARARGTLGRPAEGPATLTRAIRSRLPGRLERGQLSFSAPSGGDAAIASVPRPAPASETGAQDAPGERTEPVPAVDGRTPAGRPDAAPPRLRTSPPLNLVAAFCLLFVVGWNISSVSAYTMPAGSSSVAYSLGIYQGWNMFAPRPPHSTLWYVMVGTLGNGQRVEILTPVLRNDVSLAGPVQWEQPDNIAGSYYRDKYWRKYVAAIAEPGRDDERQAFASYVCRTWNAAHIGDLDVDSLQYVLVSERTLPDGERGEQSRKNVANFTCD